MVGSMLGRVYSNSASFSFRDCYSICSFKGVGEERGSIRISRTIVFMSRTNMLR
jgi:hypothetical protein